MISTDAMDGLLIEAAQLADWLYVEAAGTSWHVLMNDTHADGLDIELDGLRKVLTLSAEVGVPAVAEPDKKAFHEVVLAYNYYARTTSGLRLALTPAASGSFALMRDIAASDLTAQDLVAQLSDFSQKTLAWRDVMARPPAKSNISAIEAWQFLAGKRA